jgi:hypothetical protein
VVRTTERSGLGRQQEEGIPVFSKMQQTNSGGHTEIPVRGVPGLFTPGVKRTISEAEQLPLCLFLTVDG